ncbi:MAG: nucleotide disphospho-sugar-binding domain-containing protein [Nanoarchaeota archaeon]
MSIKVLGLVHGEFSSHTVRVLEIAKALRDKGYDISFSGHGDQMKNVEKQGFRIIETKTVPGSEILNGIEGTLFPVIFNKDNIEEIFKEEDELLRREKPDMIIRDSFRELAGIASKQYGIYDVFVQQANLSQYYHADFKPRTTPEFLRILPEDRVITIPFTDFAPFIRLGERIFRGRISKWMHHKVKKLGLKLDKKCYEGVEADLTLFPDSSLLFPFENMKDKYKFIGPMLISSDSEGLDWFEKFRSDDRGRIIASSGSTGMQDRTGLFIETFRNSDYAVAIHNNSKELPSGLYGGRFNVGDILDSADVFITHGGIGSTYLGLVSGVPMISIYSHFEQQANAVQLKKLGVGIPMSCDKVSPENLRENVSCILGDNSYKEKAIEISGKIRGEAEGSLESAVKYITNGYEEFIRK